MDDEEARIIWMAGEEVGRREERTRIIEALDKLACNNAYCREAKLMRTHAGCRAVRENIELIEKDAL
jgi:hypothetical protein